MSRSRPRFAAVAIVLIVPAFVLAGFVLTAASATSTPDPRAESIRLGYLPNVTHATALVGIERETYATALGPTRLVARPFNAGPDAALALMSGAIDAAYLGPNPAINAFLHSGGEALRVIAGAASGGAALVVRKGIEEPKDLRGAKVATPQLGGTQDVALRWWLARHGMATTPEGGGDVEILPQKNGQTLAAFRQGILDGAWLPEPWASRLVMEAGAHVLADEADLFGDGGDTTTVLAVRTDFLARHPEVVRRLLEGQIAATRFLGEHPLAARTAVSRAIAATTGQSLTPEVLAAAWRRLAFSDDLAVASITEAARRAHAVGLLPRTDLDGLVELDPLRTVQAAEPRDPGERR